MFTRVDSNTRERVPWNRLKSVTSLPFRVDAVEHREPGLLQVKGHLTKAGVFPYEATIEGKSITALELRPPAEVFDQESLDTLLGSPVTILHPEKFVDEDNWQKLSVGFVDSVEVRDPFVEGSLLIVDSKAIRKIDQGDLIEVSCGYMADIEVAPTNARYDFVQKNIKYNHCALGPADWARLGVSLHTH